jgi:hypothetical protein
MRKLTVLLLLLVAGTLSYAQTNQQLLEAYRNGTLSESQIGELRKESAQAIRRIRRMYRETEVLILGLLYLALQLLRRQILMVWQ